MRVYATVAMLIFGSMLGAQDKPRVFVTDSQSWEIQGSSGGSRGTYGGRMSGGARPQTAEIVKTFGERCPDVVINNRKERADYVVVLDHEGGKGLVRKDNKVAVFNSDGDSIVSRSTRSLGSSVQNACNAIRADWPKRTGAQKRETTTSLSESAATKPPEFTGTKARITSDPIGADIEIDGNFVGSTPSAVDLAPGEHTVAIKRSGYKSWERKIKTTAGEINVSASLEKQQ